MREARFDVEARRPDTLKPNAPDLLPMIVWWCLRPVAPGKPDEDLSGASDSSSDIGGLEG
jgi:hypothetical protein